MLCGHVVALAEDQNGNHVLQRCMELYPDSVHFISRELQGSVISTSCQKYGCRVIQRLVTAVASNPAYHSVLLATIDEVVTNLQHLATDQFGNYVVQALMTCRQEAGLKLIYLLRGAYPILCRHKNASNVVETAFQVSPPSLRNALITELLPFIVQLSGDPFGNFVVQKLYDLTDAANQAQLSAAIRSGSSVLKMNIYGRSVLGMLARKEGAGAPNVPSQTQVHAAAPQQQQQQQQQQQAQAQQSSQQLPQSLYIGLPSLQRIPSFAQRPPTAPQQQQQQQQPPPGLQQRMPSFGSFCAPPASPLTPATPNSATLSFTSSGDWMHNPNYNAIMLPPVDVQQDAVPTLRRRRLSRPAGSLRAASRRGLRTTAWPRLLRTGTSSTLQQSGRTK